MKLATWNINGLNARLDFVAHWLEARQPDVVGLQELKLTEDRFPQSRFEDLGYQCSVLGQKSWNGVAVLSRQPIEIEQRGLPGQEDLGARLLAVRTAGLTFVSLYCPNGKSVGHPDFERKLAWFDDLATWLQGTCDPSTHLVLGGDFNICPSPLDSWNEARLADGIFHTRDERSRFAGLLGWGLHDLYRVQLPEGTQFSWWDYRAGAFHKNQGLRIDFLLGTASIRDQLQGVVIDREYRKKKDGMLASDHAPVIAELSALDQRC